MGIRIGKKTLSSKITRVFGGIKTAHSRLLKETIEFYLSGFRRASSFKLPSINYLYHILSEISGTNTIGWLVDWQKGRILLESDYNNIFNLFRPKSFQTPVMDAFIKEHYIRFYGVTLRDIERMMLKQTAEQISNDLGIHIRALKRSFDQLGGFLDIKNGIRKKVAIELLSMGITPHRIVTTTWGYRTDITGAEVERAFETIFGMTYQDIRDTNWVLYVRNNKNYWIDFLGLVIGEDY